MKPLDRIARLSFLAGRAWQAARECPIDNGPRFFRLMNRWRRLSIALCAATDRYQNEGR